jgi:hypothetical protein
MSLERLSQVWTLRSLRRVNDVSGLILNNYRMSTLLGDRHAGLESNRFNYFDLIGDRFDSLCQVLSICLDRLDILASVRWASYLFAEMSKV